MSLLSGQFLPVAEHRSEMQDRQGAGPLPCAGRSARCSAAAA